MLVSDARFGALVVTRTGKSLVFDSIECMTKYVKGLPRGEVRDTWVIDANAPGALIKFDDASLVRDRRIRPPMGTVYTVAAHAT